MKAIKFTDSELEFLIHHYELELIEAEAYMGEIRGILKKLGVISKETVVEQPVKVAKKRGRPRLEKPVVKDEPLPVLVEKKERAKRKSAPAKAKPGPKPAPKMEEAPKKKVAPKKKATPVKKLAPVKKATPKKRATPVKNPAAPTIEPAAAPEVTPMA